MTRNQTTIAIASILTTLAELGKAPAGIVYAGLMANGISHGDYMELQTMLVSSNLVTLKSNVMRLTSTGRELADECNSLISA